MLKFITQQYQQLITTKQQEMKSFNYTKIEARMQKKSQKQLAQQQNQQNFLRLYDDIPPDPKMQKYCADVRQQFDQRRKNSRYYSYELPKKQQKISDAFEIRVGQIKKLSNYSMPFKQGQKSEKQKQRERKQQQSILELQKQKKRKHLIKLQLKFKYQIKTIVAKMKKMKITIQDIMAKELFKKQAYRFGNQIFLATKEGNPEKVWRILIQNKFSIFSLDNTYKTPLMWSCIRNHPKVTKILLEFGMDSNKKDINGLDALNYAIRYNNAECVKLLMLELANAEEIHHQDSKLAHQKVRNVYNVALGLIKMFKKIKYEKRLQLFQQQYDYLYKQSK